MRHEHPLWSHIALSRHLFSTQACSNVKLPIFALERILKNIIPWAKWRQLNEQRFRNTGPYSWPSSVKTISTGGTGVAPSWPLLLGLDEHWNEALGQQLASAWAAMNLFIWSDVSFWPNFTVGLRVQAEKTRLMCWSRVRLNSRIS